MNIRLMACAVVAFSICSAKAETNQPARRPFQTIVEMISVRPLQEQKHFVTRLSQGLMAEDFAMVTRRGDEDVPHFGHLARELLEQKKFELMRALLKDRKLDPYNYYTIAELLAVRLDQGTFDILITNSSLTIPPPPGEEGYESGPDIVAGEGTAEYSAFCLGHYLESSTYGKDAEAHLIKILKEHKRTGVRAFAAWALSRSKSPETVNALESATKDKGWVPSEQGPFNQVYEYAEDALSKIKKAH